MKAMSYTTTALLVSMGAAVFLAAPVAADCDNYGNQVNVGSDYDCHVDHRQCEQHSGAGAGAGAGAGGAGGGEAEAGANAGTSQNCDQSNGGSSGTVTGGVGESYDLHVWSTGSLLPTSYWFGGFDSGSTLQVA